MLNFKLLQIKKEKKNISHVSAFNITRFLHKILVFCCNSTDTEIHRRGKKEICNSTDVNLWKFVYLFKFYLRTVLKNM